MTAREPADDDPTGTVVADDGTDRTRSLSTTDVLVGANRRLQRHPSVFVALLVAGLVVAGIDLVQFHDPVPTSTYEGIQQGRFAVSFSVVVTIVSRAGVSFGALLNLEPQWLALTVGAQLLEIAVVALAGGYALARLLDVEVTPLPLLRYGLAVFVLRVGATRATFEGEAMVLALPLLVAVFVVMVRLVPFPGRVIGGETVWTALCRSWTSTRGHGWTLLGVVLVLGVTAHLFASLPVVGPIGTAAVAAVHAAVVVTIITRLDAPGPADRERTTGDGSL